MRRFDTEGPIAFSYEHVNVPRDGVGPCRGQQCWRIKIFLEGMHDNSARDGRVL